MAVDTNFNNVVLLLHCDGPNTSTTFTDSSPVPKTVTANGNAQISTAQSKFGGASALFDGSGDYLTSTSNDFLLGTGDHTIEFWFKNNDPTGATTGCATLCMGNATNYWQIILKSTTVRLNRAISGSGADDISINQSIDTNWHHFAWVKSGSTNTFYFDGASIGSWTRADWSFVTLNTLYIGANFNTGTTGLSGNIDDIRITKGVARYTTNFTAPTEAFPDSGPVSNFMPYIKSKGANDIYNYVLPINFLYF